MKETTKIINNNGYEKNRNDINKENTIIINKIKKKRRNKKITISILFVLITILIIADIYVLKNRNWIYKLDGESETFKSTNSLFVYDGKTYFLMIGNFEIKNQDILKEDIESVRLMCNDRLIIGSNTFITGMERENKGYNELFPKEVVNNLNDWYYEIKYKSDDGIKTEILKINNKEIKEIALNNYSNGASIYMLVNNNYLDHIINKINDEKTYPNTLSVVKKGYLTGNEQFVDVLNETLFYFNSCFLPLEHKETHFANLLENYIPQFLLCKKYCGNNKYIPYYRKNMQKLIAKNFYENIKYIYEDYTDFFNNINITNTLTLNTSEELEKIVTLMEEFVWCNCKYKQFSLSYLFTNHKCYEKSIKKRYFNKKLDVKKVVYKDYCMHWEILINQYKKNINYVKKFLK